MKNNNILTFVSKDKGLLIGLVFSLVTHLFLFTLFPSKEDKLLGDKYIPIEIVDIKSPIIKGDSINESEKTNNEKISNTENNFKQKSEEKLEKKIDYKKIEDYKKETINKKIEESSLKKTTLEQSQLENENKIRGIEKGIKSNKTEAGSIQGKGYQKVTCLNCVEPTIELTEKTPLKNSNVCNLFENYLVDGDWYGRKTKGQNDEAIVKCTFLLRTIANYIFFTQPDTHFSNIFEFYSS